MKRQATPKTKRQAETALLKLTDIIARLEELLSTADGIRAAIDRLPEEEREELIAGLVDEDDTMFDYGDTPSQFFDRLRKKNQDWTRTDWRELSRLTAEK